MAIATNNLTVLLASGPNAGQNVSSGGMTIYQTASADNPETILFDAQLWRLGLVYVSTDILYLVAYNSTTKRTVEYACTLSGTNWTYTPDSSHFDGGGVAGGTATSWSAHFVLRRDTGTGAAPVARTATFTLSVNRGYPMSPSAFGTCCGWYDARDLDTTVGATLTTWYDKSGLERDLTGAGAPKYYEDTIGRSHVRFDGVDDTFASTLLFPASMAVVMACRFRAIDATYRPALSWGASAYGGFYLNTTNIKAFWNATSVTATAVPNPNEWFITGGYKLDDGAQNVIYGSLASAPAVGTSAGTETNAPGVLKLAVDTAGTPVWANIDIAEVWCFSAWSSGALSTITTFTGALEDAVRALGAKHGVI